MNTAEDYRILMAEKAVEFLIKTLESAKFSGKWDRKSAISAARKILPEIQAIKYSYMDAEDIANSDFINRIRERCQEILTSLGGREWWKKIVDKNSEEHAARIRFSLNIIYNLPGRLLLKCEIPACAVDIRCGEVISVSKHPNADKLLICNVNIGRKITVVTNDLSLREGDRVAVALLPPAVLRGVLSEGMFVGCGDGVAKDVEGEIGNFPRNLDEKCLKEVSSKVMEFLNS